MTRLPTFAAIILTLGLALVAFACDGGDQDSATPTPTPTITPVGTPSPDSTPSSPELGAVRITPPENRREFVDQLEDEQILGERCTYDATSGTADCGARGLYELDPPLPGDEGECSVFLVEDQPIAVSCATATTAAIYAIP
jgi:hypothetical protein